MTDPKNTRNRKRRWPWVIAGILLLIGVWQLIADLYLEEEKQLRRQLRETVPGVKMTSTIGLATCGKKCRMINKNGWMSLAKI
jgi:hypothetical protein